MAGNSSITLNPGTGGAQTATYQSSESPIGFMHQKVLLETQSGTSDPVVISAANPLPIQGPSAQLATATGNPLQCGGVYYAAPPTIGNGQAFPLLLDINGNVCVNIKAGAAAGGTSGNIGGSVATVATPVSFSNGSTMQLGQVDGSGNIKVNIAAGGVPAGSDNSTFTANTTQGIPFFGVYNDGIGALTSGNEGAIRLTSDRKVYVAAGASVSGGWTNYGTNSAASTNSTNVKASAGQIGWLNAFNNGAAVAWLKMYNKASAPTVGTDTPVQRYLLPPGGGVALEFPGASAYTTGIGFGITGGAADSDTTAVLLNQVQVNIGYA